MYRLKEDMKLSSILPYKKRGVVSLITVLLVGCSTVIEKAVHNDEVDKITPPHILDIKWVQIEKGEFNMGSDYMTKVACKDGEPPENLSIHDGNKSEYCKRYGPASWFSDETPIRRVRVEHDYWISDTEITVAQFREFVHETNYITVAEGESLSLGESLSPKELEVFKATKATWKQPWPGAEVENDHPVVHVAWDDANAFCDWLTHKIKRLVRLPTEIEWEYAAKGNNSNHPSSGTYAWGSDDPSDIKVANFADQSFGELYSKWRYPVDATHNDGFARLAPVRSYPPNVNGLYDMSGNVWEWTADVHKPVNSNSDNQNDTFQLNYVMRGGSFDFELPFLRVEKRRSLAFIRKSEPIDSSISVGFRIVSTGESIYSD